MNGLEFSLHTGCQTHLMKLEQRNEERRSSIELTFSNRKTIWRPPPKSAGCWSPARLRAKKQTQEGAASSLSWWWRGFARDDSSLGWRLRPTMTNSTASCSASSFDIFRRTRSLLGRAGDRRWLSRYRCLSSDAGSTGCRSLINGTWERGSPATNHPPRPVEKPEKTDGSAHRRPTSESCIDAISEGEDFFFSIQSRRFVKNLLETKPSLVFFGLLSVKS